LKELIPTHSSTGQHSGDLNTDTITLIGAPLDFQEKVVRQVSTTLMDFPACFPPADTVHPGHDTDQRPLIGGKTVKITVGPLQDERGE